MAIARIKMRDPLKHTSVDAMLVYTSFHPTEKLSTYAMP
jgi:hypothetical protein